MRKFFTTAALVTLLASLSSLEYATAQQKQVYAKNGMNVLARNYTTFTSYSNDKAKEILNSNKGFENHPELGMLFAETPCDNCYELMNERTEISKTFVEKGKSETEARKIYRQTSTMAMHYHDNAGQWRTIKTYLAPTGKVGIYAATEQPVPVAINTINRYTTIGKPGESFTFNNDLELIYEKPDGSQISLGKANWASYTAGDNGVYIKNAWNGIDIEIYTDRGLAKTNFYINHAMPQYAGGNLLVRDHMQMDNGLSLHAGSTSGFTGTMAIRNSDGSDVFVISPAIAAEKRSMKATLKDLKYFVNGNTVDISLPGDFLNREAAAYPVIIDPLVSTATASAVGGSTYSALWTVGCPYLNPATTPANCTITDIQFTFGYITSAGAIMYDGAMDFTLGACRNPSSTALWWTCGPPAGLFGGTCTGTNQTLLPDFNACIPAPQCAPYNLNVTMKLYQNYLTTAPCATTYISGAIPFTVTVIGQTVQNGGVINAGSATICAGQSTTLSTSGSFGVPPYTFSWMPGALVGSPVTVSPIVTTTYTATVTDACGITATATSTITVNPVPAITGTLAVCVGGTTTLSNATGGGTWTSSNTGVATVGSSSGIVYGVSPGITTITYTTPSGCTTTATVTVNVLSGITGTTTICVNGTSTLGNALAGGTWSSSNTAIASVNATTGVVTGMSPGNVTITYVTGSGCSTTIAFTVNPLPAAIAGPSAVCVGATISLTDATPSGTWTSSATGVVTVGAGTGIAGGVAAGVANITYTLPTGCLATKAITVNPIFSTSFSVVICPGTSYTYAGTTYSTTGVYPHLFSSVYGCDSVSALNLTVSPITHTTVNDSICTGGAYSFGGGLYIYSGSYNHTFTNINGCDSLVTLNLYVKPLPLAPLTTDIDLCQNATPVSPLTAVGSNLLWYNAPTGGVGNSTAPVPSTTTPGTLTWYVSQVVNGCEGPRAALNVKVHHKPNYTVVPGKPYECQYDTISLNYNGPMFPGATFTWTVPNYATITGGTIATDPSIVVRFDTSLGNNTVYLTVGDGYLPCNSTVAYNVPVFLTAPPAFFNSHPNVCAGDSVLVALTYTSEGINDYIWNFDGGNVVVASSDHGGPYKVVWSIPGIYVITLNAVTNVNCPASTILDTVHVQARPDARIAPFALLNGKTTVCMGDSIIFRPLNFDDRYSYFWSPEHYFTQDNASRQYGVVDNAGYIKLTVRTPFGCPATDSILVDAQPCCTISFPTAFTPNGDGKNDVFRPITEGNQKIHFFRIANRWGQNVFESLEGAAGAWDGTYNDVKQDMGVYYYFISFDCAGKKVIQKGEVTLIR